MKLIVISLCIGLTGCGTFQLGTVAGDKPTAQRDQDIVSCRDRAAAEANTTARAAASFLVGMTIVGAPLAAAEDMRKQREVFGACMQERGYVVTMGPT